MFSLLLELNSDATVIAVKSAKQTNNGVAIEKFKIALP